MDKPTLSIYVPVYNHEAYIERTLDSIRMQVTDYSFEVLVGEDCSPDRSREIIKEYEKKYPGFLTVYYRDHNMHKDVVGNIADLRSRCKGKYVILLEGDDYWIDPHKIDKQIRFLETHPQYLVVGHRCIVVDHDSKERDEVYPHCLEPEYTFKHFTDGLFPGQTATIMLRNIDHDSDYDCSILKKRLSPGDCVKNFWMLANGRVYCMPEVMSAYRYVTDCGSSFSATQRYSFDREYRLYTGMIEYARKIGNGEAEACAEYLLFKSLFTGLRRKCCDVRMLIKEYRSCRHKVKTPFRYLMFRIKKDIFRKKLYHGYGPDGKRFVGWDL